MAAKRAAPPSLLVPRFGFAHEWHAALMSDRRQASPELATEGQAFDLNIEKVLEHWTIPFAIRELIANALDEQTLTGTSEPVIFKDGNGCWHVTDHGRGVRRNTHVIGHFGMA